MNVTHGQTAELQAFEKISSDMKRCFETWEAGGIPASLALWAKKGLRKETLRNALPGDGGQFEAFMLAAMNSSLKAEEEKN